MAQLKDLLVVGSAHFIGDVYFNKIPKYNNTNLALNREITISNGNGIAVDKGTINLNENKVGVIISHADTSTVSDLSAVDRTYVTSLTFDDYGHVIGYDTGSENDDKFNDYKTLQNPVLSPSVQTGDDPVLEFIDTISQDENGVISATKKAVDLSNYVTKTDYVTAMEFKGTLGESGTESSLAELTARDHGDMYRVITAGTYTYTVTVEEESIEKEITVQVGDAIVWNKDASEWTIIPSGDEPSGTVTQISAGTGLSTVANSEVAGDPIVSSGTLYIRNKGITAAQIADSTITATQIYDATITGTKIDSNTIDITNLKNESYSSSGNRDSGKIVTSAAAGQIDSEKYAVTSGANVKATMQYDTTAKAVKFVFAT